MAKLMKVQWVKDKPNAKTIFVTCGPSNNALVEAHRDIRRMKCSFKQSPKDQFTIHGLLRANGDVDVANVVQPKQLGQLQTEHFRYCSEVELNEIIFISAEEFRKYNIRILQKD